MWRRIRMELLACLTLKPELADDEKLSSAVAPAPAAQNTMKLSLAELLGNADPAAARKQQEASGLAVIYSGPGGVEKEVADFLAREAKAKAGLGVGPPAVALEAAPALRKCKAAVIVCSAAPGVDAMKGAAGWLDAASAMGGDFKGLSFAVLAIGDSSALEMQPPRVLRQRLLAGGARELVGQAEARAEEMAEVLEPWVASLIPPLQKAVQPSEDAIKAVTSGLFQQLGGAAGIASIFDAWLLKAQGDWRVRRFVDGAQDEAVKAQMGQWLAAALGGPLPYRGPDASALVARLAQEKGLNNSHLDTLAQLLAGVMADLGIAAELIDSAMDAVGEQRRRIA